MRRGISFILPTRNRVKFVKRAIDSCLAISSKTIGVKVIVIDGGSSDGTVELIRSNYASNSNVLLVEKQEGKGFMPACFQGVGLIDTELATFMYDDDVLSPYFGALLENSFKYNLGFVMGYGQIYSAADLYPFKPISNVDFYSPEQLLAGYFGRYAELRYGSLPVSPICCFVKSELLCEWVPKVKEFGGKTPIRRYYMLEKNVGPDLMIYLMALVGQLKEKNKIGVASSIVAQFSAHSDSMSIQYGADELNVGYWLAKISVLTHSHVMESKGLFSELAAFLILSGLKIYIKRLCTLRFKWSGAILYEIFTICDQVIQLHLSSLVVKSGIAFLRTRWITRGRIKSQFPS